jgi:hypothetical protein
LIVMEPAIAPEIVAVIPRPATPPLLAIPAIAFPTEITSLRGTKALTRAQKLVKALKVCRKEKSKGKRAGCERLARKRYGAVKKRMRA